MLMTSRIAMCIINHNYNYTQCEMGIINPCCKG